MKMIVPIAITDAVLASSTVPETDYAAWSSGATYAAGDRRISTATHKVYESVAGSNTNHDPTTDDGTWWVEVGSTNRWRAFDAKTGQAVSNPGSIVYEFTLPSICTAVGLVGVDAGSVQVEIEDSGGATVYDETRNLVDATDIISWFTYFTYVPDYTSRAVFTGLPGYVGYTMRITIEAGIGTAEVGEISIGRLYEFGGTMPDTELGFEDLSTIERDAYGNVAIVERGKFDTVLFRFAIAVGGEDRVRRTISAQRAKPAFYFSDENNLARGAVVYGLAKPLRIPLSGAGVSYASLEVEELS